jgi:alpha-galactosidase
MDFLYHTPPSVRCRPADSAHCTVRQERAGDCRRFQVTNLTAHAVNVHEVVLASGRFPWAPATTAFYGEGFQMLSQYGGTLAEPRDIGPYSDRAHYKLPQTPGAFTVYSLLTLSPAEADHVVLAFTSCRRFSGEFRLFPDGRFEIVVDTEGLCLAPGETWELEELMAVAGPDRHALLATVAARMAVQHPRLPFPEIPTGWCSWYHYYERVTADDIAANLDAISEKVPELKYIQIDDGYQAAMGDWLEPGEKFAGGVAPLIGKIRAQGFEPAIWVAPFIAEAKSRVFREHPEWFIGDGEGRPLASDRVSFGGWRCGPWYALDGTHPAVQEHFENLFRIMRNDWGCTYFKLDANSWGALHGGHFHDPAATRIEAYRRGMEAILRGAGDAFVLGCNAPMWPSLGLVHGMRVTGDIDRSWNTFASVADELFHRNWQHGRLWINDPDCLVLRNLPGQEVSEDEYSFHIATIAASGAMLLAGDDMTALPEARLNILRKLLPPSGVPAVFDDPDFRIGRMTFGEDRQRLFIFNREETAQSVQVRLPFAGGVTHVLTGEALGLQSGSLAIPEMKPHSASILDCVRVPRAKKSGKGNTRK